MFAYYVHTCHDLGAEVVLLAGEGGKGGAVAAAGSHRLGVRDRTVKVELVRPPESVVPVSLRSPWANILEVL